MARGRAAHLVPLPRASSSAAYFLVGDEPVAQLPAQTFQATATRAEVKVRFERRNVYIWFQIVATDPPSAPYHGVEVPFVCPLKGARFGPRSKFVKAWTRVTGRRPRASERISPTTFLRKLYTIRTRTVVIDYQQRPHDALSYYSVVDEIVSVDVGGRA